MSGAVDTKASDGVNPNPSRQPTKKEAAQLTPDCTASNLKSGSWCPSVFVYEYSPSTTFVPKPGKKVSAETIPGIRTPLGSSMIPETKAAR
jgi:hypothetical protein